MWVANLRAHTTATSKSGITTSAANVRKGYLLAEMKARKIRSAAFSCRADLGTMQAMENLSRLTRTLVKN